MGRLALRIARRVLCAAALLSGALAASRSACAHEFWIEPSAFTVDGDQTLRVTLLVGDLNTAGRGDEIMRTPELIARFSASSPGWEVPIGGLPGRAPAGLVRLQHPGYATLIYRSLHSYIELPAEKFESYLEDEGLSDIVAARQRSGNSLTPGRESYARYCKSLVYVATADESKDADAKAPPAFDYEVGLPLEIIAESNPSLWRDGDALSFRLLYEGLPLPDQQVRLTDLDEPTIRLTSRTDAEGRVKFFPPDGGRFLAATVYMRPAPAGVKGDWESFWGSLTFETPRNPT